MFTLHSILPDLTAIFNQNNTGIYSKLYSAKLTNACFVLSYIPVHEVKSPV